MTLIEAILSGDVERVRDALEAGADPNALDDSGKFALHEAARRGDLAILELLLEHGADVPESPQRLLGGKTVLEWCVRRRARRWWS